MSEPELCYVLRGVLQDRFINPRVEVYEVVKWTESTVVVRQRSGTIRMNLVTEWHQVFRSIEELRAAVGKLVTKSIESTEREFDEQGDSDWTYRCGHPEMPADRVYLSYTPRPPVQCPLRAAAIAAKVKSLGFVSIRDVKMRLPTKAYLDTIERRAKAATAGPWTSDYQPVGPCGAKCCRDQIIAYTPVSRTMVAMRPNAAFNGPGKAAREQEIADGDFISNARGDIPKLLANIGSVHQLIGDE